MGRVKGSKNILKVSESGKPFTSTLPLEEHLRIIATLIVDRVIEDQQSGKLQIKQKV